MRDAPGTLIKKNLQLVSREWNREVQRQWGMLLQSTEDGKMLRKLVRGLREGWLAEELEDWVDRAVEILPGAERGARYRRIHGCE